MKEYKGHSRKFYVHIEKMDELEGMDNPPDSEIIFNIVQDMKNHLSPAKALEMAKWCLSFIKYQQEKNPAKVKWYEDALEQILNEKIIHDDWQDEYKLHSKE